MSVSPRALALLQGEMVRIQAWLDRFDAPYSGGARQAILGRTGEYLIVKNIPLPDWCRPDYLDLLLLVDQFPTRPPIGLYLLNQGNKNLVAQISSRHHAFKNQAYHEVPAVNGYTWICYAYGGNSWRYDVQAPARSDNLAKFLQAFYAELA